MLSVLLLSHSVAWATTFTVTKTADTLDGTCDADCSLREAITAANADVSTPHAINFNIDNDDPGRDTGCDQTTHVCTLPVNYDSGGIQPLPTITKTVVIDGYSEPFSAGCTNDFPGAINSAIKIQIDGTGTPNGTDGITINAGSTVIKGLSIYGFPDAAATYTAYGIIITNTSGVNNIKIQGCFIGIKADGETVSKNQGTGILSGGLNNSNTVIGTDSDGVNDAAERNVISGNDNSAIWMIGSSTIMGNFVGTDFDGTVDKGNRLVGILINATTTIGTNGDGVRDSIEGNLIAGNTTSGIKIIAGNNSKIAGNIIGLDRTGLSKGSVDVANGAAGVWIASAVSGSVIGSNNDGTSDNIERNIIANNGQNAINITLGGSATIRNNYLGLGIDGTTMLKNGSAGAYDNICIGFCPFSTSGAQSGNTTIDKNYIVGQFNGSGIALMGSGTNTITNNYIGVKVDGNASANNNNGILITTGTNPATFYSFNNTISGNVIANNGDATGDYGIKLAGVDSDKNIFSQNSMYSNFNGGINLAGDGSNNDQAAPTIATEACVGHDMQIGGTSGNGNVIEFFIASSNNEGKSYLFNTTADGAGAWTFTYNGQFSREGTKLVATAKDATNGTSGFSSLFTLSLVCRNRYQPVY